MTELAQLRARADAELGAADAALRGGERRFRALVEASSDVLYRMSPDWAEMRQLSGGGFIADAPEPTRGWVDAYIHPDDRPLVRAAIDDAIRRKGAFELEHRVLRPDGGHGWTHSRAVPILDADGAVSEWFGAASDVTERKAAEARLAALVELGDRLRDLRDPGEIGRASSEVIGSVLGSDSATFALVDPDGDGVRVEGEWSCGHSPARLVGRHWLSEAFAPPVLDAFRRGEVLAVADVRDDPRTAAHAAGMEALGVRASVHVPVLAAGRLAAFFCAHAGRPRAWTAEEAAFVRGAAERAWTAIERARAEAALRESEGRRRAALDAARLGTWEWDTATGVAVLDGRAREILGLAPDWGDRAEGVFDRIHRADRPRVLAESAAAAAARGRLDTEYRVSLPGGGERAVASLGDALPDAGDRPARMAGVFADVTERRRAEERRALLVAELNHRVKNTLAVVQSLALQTARGAPDLPAFTAAFQARLIALARAHDLLTRRDWEGAPLAEVARAALEPAGGGARVDLGACASDAPLAPAQALALALALHELATNAAKHGALSAPGGRVSVACRADPDDGTHVVEWAERGGPPVARPPAQRGFGLRLLERGLAAQAGMAADLRFEPEGVRCTLRLPSAHRAAAGAA